MDDTTATLEVRDERMIRRVVVGSLLLFAAIEMSVAGDVRAMVAVAVIEVVRAAFNAVMSRRPQWFSSAARSTELIGDGNLALNLLTSHVVGWTLPALLYLPYHFLVSESLRRGARLTNVLAIGSTLVVAALDGIAEEEVTMLVFGVIVWLISSGRGAILHGALEREASARAESEKSREQYRAIVENAHAVPCVFELGERRFTYVGRQAHGVLGCAAEAWTSRAFVDERVHPDERAQLLGAFGGRQRDVEFRLRRDDGTWTWVRFAFAPTERSDVRGVLLDVDARHQIELELAHAHKLSAIGSLAAGVAHELNTPSQFVADNLDFVAQNVARLFSDVGRDAEEDAALRTEIPAALEDAKVGIARVTSIVKAMKEFSHPSTGVFEPIDLKSAVENTVTVARNEWKYVADVDVAIPAALSVPGLRDELNQVILNLVVNAAHAIEAKGDGARGHIIVDGRVEDGEAVLRIADDGIGMSEAVRQRIFEPFFTTKPIGKGTGQGLAIAWSIIVDKHGGTIWVDTEPGLGSIFTIRLPLTAPSTPSKRASSSFAAEQTRTPSGAGARVEHEAGARIEHEAGASM